MDAEVLKLIRSGALPSYEEFCKNPDKWRTKQDSPLAQVEEAGKLHKQIIKKVRYEIQGHKCKTLEEVERIAKDYGIPINELEFKPEIIPLAGLKCDILVKFVRKCPEGQVNA